MRKCAAAILSVLCVAVIVGCAHKQPPTGRWEGAYETDDDMVAVRLEIAANGTIYLSAPDAMDIGGTPPDTTCQTTVTTGMSMLGKMSVGVVAIAEKPNTRIRIEATMNV